MVMNAVPLADGYLAVKVEGTGDTIDAFLYDLVFSQTSVSLVTATDTRDSIDDSEDVKEAVFLLRIEMQGKATTEV